MRPKATERISELQRHVGDVSEKMLSQQLREMVADGLLRRIDFKTIPPHVEYEMTAFGRDLGLAMVPICEWGSRNMDEVTAIAEARAIRRGMSGSRLALEDSPRFDHEPAAIQQMHSVNSSPSANGI